MKKYFVSNDTMSTVLKFNKCETCQPKIANALTIGRYVLVGCYFYTRLSYDVISFNIKYIFIS